MTKRPSLFLMVQDGTAEEGEEATTLEGQVGKQSTPSPLSVPLDLAPAHPVRNFPERTRRLPKGSFSDTVPLLIKLSPH
ncbi:hypothetical protein NDU88_001292 [Pleurodeles waltl]|uniref:Uncharacterized protein n=1 Tax=Pleurodeles waltl TaxID=8319 RepID=A0AAV7MKI1_PLEWA|nr:hypothetical protein NDU88_001292 [Pleurodeles waltl]